MLILLARACLHLLANAVGLLIAAAVLPGFHISALALVTVTLIFTIVEVVAGPLLVSISLREMPALTGGVSLVITFLGLLITAWLSDGLNIDGASTWLLASLIVWLASLLAGVVLPLFLFKKTMESRRGRGR